MHLSPRVPGPHDSSGSSPFSSLTRKRQRRRRWQRRKHRMRWQGWAWGQWLGKGADDPGVGSSGDAPRDCRESPLPCGSRGLPRCKDPTPCHRTYKSWERRRADAGAAAVSSAVADRQRGADAGSILLQLPHSFPPPRLAPRVSCVARQSLLTRASPCCPAGSTRSRRLRPLRGGWACCGASSDRAGRHAAGPCPRAAVGLAASSGGATARILRRLALL